MVKAFMNGINQKRAIISVFALFVYIFVTDFLIHGVFMRGTYQETSSLWRPDAEMNQKFLFLVLGQLLIAKMVTYIFAKGYEGKGIGEGVRFGLVIGLLMSGPCLINYAVMPLTCSIVCWWIVLGIIQTIGGGALLTFTYKR